MINCNENENYNEKTDDINKTYIDQHVATEKKIQNIACLGKTMPLCKKQHLKTFEAQFIEKLSNTEAGLKKKALLIKKKTKKKRLLGSP